MNTALQNSRRSRNWVSLCSEKAHCMLCVQNAGLKNSPGSLFYLFHGAKKNHMSHKWQLPLGLPKPHEKAEVAERVTCPRSLTANKGWRYDVDCAKCCAWSPDGLHPLIL
ncbi:uncharacterized protein LOC144296822 [Canis aureus]